MSGVRINYCLSVYRCANPLDLSVLFSIAVARGYNVAMKRATNFFAISLNYGSCTDLHVGVVTHNLNFIDEGFFS
jgi:hypothetical protein